MRLIKPKTAAVFKEAMAKIGLHTPQSFVCHTMEESLAAQAEVGFPHAHSPLVYHGRLRRRHCL